MTLSGKSVDEVMQWAYDVLSYFCGQKSVVVFGDPEPVHRLVMYDSHAWLATMHENQMFNLF